MPVVGAVRPGIRPSWLFFALVALLTCVGSFAAGAHERAGLRPLRFGVFPYLPPLTLDRIFQPIVADLSQAAGRPVHLRTRETFAAFKEALAEGSYDLILVHPFFYTYAADATGYEPIARLDQDFVAVLLARPERELTGLRDLKGRVLGLPDELSAVSILLKVALLEHDVRPEQDVSLRHFESKASCLLAAVVGDVDACAVPRFVLRQIKVDDELDLETVYETPPAPHLLLAAHPRLAQSICVDILQTVLAWSESESGANMLEARGWQRFVQANDADYQTVRALELRASGLLMHP